MSTPHPSTRRPAVARPRVPRSPLRLVPEVVGTTPRTPFVLLVVSLLAGGLVGLLLLNTSMQNGAFQLAALEQKAESLQTRQAELSLEVERRSTPEAVAKRAAKLGMVPSSGPVFLRLPDGETIGDPEPATSSGPPSGLGGPAPDEVGDRE